MSTSSATARQRSSISAISSAISCSSSARASFVASTLAVAVSLRSAERADIPRREAALEIAPAIERVLRLPPNSAPSTAPAPATSSVVRRERVSVSSSSTRRSAWASALSSRSRFASSRSRIFAASASACAWAAASQRSAKSSWLSPGRDTTFSARFRCSSSGRRSTRRSRICFAVVEKNASFSTGTPGRTNTAPGGADVAKSRSS